MRAPLNPLSAMHIPKGELKGGFQETLNWGPMMPRGASFSGLIVGEIPGQPCVMNLLKSCQSFDVFFLEVIKKKSLSFSQALMQVIFSHGFM